MNLKDKIETVESSVIDWMSVRGILLLRVSISVVFFWFGFQKFFPGISSAEDIATRTIDVVSFGLVKAPYSMPILAGWESLIGLGFLTGKYLRFTVALLYLQMAGTLFPLFIFPEETFFLVPVVPTLEGQYIIKNIVIITATMVILVHDREKRNKKLQETGRVKNG